MSKRVTLWFIIILVVAVIFVDLPFNNLTIPKTKINLAALSANYPVKFGLDLQGGTELVLDTDMSKIAPADQDDALESARQVIERRVNAFGVSEAVVESSKVGNDRRILVDLPGVKNASAAATLVGQTAQLEFRELPASPSAQASNSAEVISYDTTVPTGLTGADLQKASVVFNSGTAGANGSPQVSLQFNDQGAKKFADITKRNVGKPLPIFLDQTPVSAPVVQGEILGGNAVITGSFTTDQAKQLAIQLNAGALKVPVKIIQERSISASLGQESVQKSLIAGIIGIAIIVIYMISYYGFLGLVADLALCIYALTVFAIFKTGLFILPPVTLSLSGIAGFILSIGMAVDANILIFERMKEERRWGHDSKKALDLGFRRAWSSIRDSNISSLITASILFYFGTSIVQGFALTLAIGVLVSMFTAVVVTRTFLKVLYRIK